MCGLVRIILYHALQIILFLFFFFVGHECKFCMDDGVRRDPEVIEVIDYAPDDGFNTHKGTVFYLL